MNFLGLTAPQSPDQAHATAQAFSSAYDAAAAAERQQNQQKTDRILFEKDRAHNEQLAVQKSAAALEQQRAALAEDRRVRSNEMTGKYVDDAIKMLAPYTDGTKFNSDDTKPLAGTLQHLLNTKKAMAEAELSGGSVMIPPINFKQPDYSPQYKQQLQAEATEAINKANLTGQQVIGLVSGTSTPRGSGSSSSKGGDDPTKENPYERAANDFGGAIGALPAIEGQLKSLYGSPTGEEGNVAQPLHLDRVKGYEDQKRTLEIQARTNYPTIIRGIREGAFAKGDLGDPRPALAMIQARQYVNEFNISSFDQRQKILDGARQIVASYGNRGTNRELPPSDQTLYDSALRLMQLIGADVMGTGQTAH